MFWSSKPQGPMIREAANKGDAALVGKLLKKAKLKDVNEAGDEGITALMGAAKEGHADVVYLLLDVKADTESKDKDGRTALMGASYWDRANVVNLLLAAGADMHVRDKSGQTALMVAALRNKTAVVKLLLAAGADKDVKDERGMSALMLAAKYGAGGTLKVLIAAGADVRIQDTWGGLTALMMASGSQHIGDAVKLLLDAGADVHAQDMDGWTALMSAASNHQRGAVQLLLAAGASVHAQTKDGRTVLMVACWREHSGVMQLLLAAGADIHVQREDGRTALMIAAASTSGAEVVKLLLAAGADRNVQDKDGKTALDLASTPEIKILLTTAACSQSPQVGPSAPASATKAPAVAAALPPVPAPTRDSTALTAAAGNVARTAVPRDAPLALMLRTAGITSKETSEAAAAAFSVKEASEDVVPADQSEIRVDAVKSSDHLAYLLGEHAGSAIVPIGKSDASFFKARPADIPIGSVSPAHPLAEVDGMAIKSRSESSEATGQRATFDASALTTQDRGALTAFLQHSTELLHCNARLQQVMRTVAAHDRTLQMLVSKEKECPSLFWFYPKRPELRRWLSDPAKCLFQDTLMMMVVCPVTLCVVECGPDGVGWEVDKPKEWVKKWGPAILFSIYVMQAAVVAGRVVGIPLPPVPGAGELKEALGLKGVLGDVFSIGANQVNLKDSLKALRDTTAAALDQTPASRALCASLQSQSGPLPADLPMNMVGEAYKSMHTFLTTGENAKLGKLEDQLRGRMERVMAPDGDIEWVSVQGRDAWLQKHSALALNPTYTVVDPTVPSLPHSSSPTPVPPVTLSVATVSISVAVEPVSASPVNVADQGSGAAATGSSWLAARLLALGLSVVQVRRCEEVLVEDEGFTTEAALASLVPAEFHLEYLRSIGITAKGTASQLVSLHRELHAQHCAIPATAAPEPSSPQPATRAMDFTEEDRKLLRQLKLQQRAPEPTTTHTVDRGNQMQYTASAFSQQGPQAAQNQQQLARRIAELEARLQTSLADITSEMALQLEDVHGRVDSLTTFNPGSSGNGNFKLSK